MSVGCVGSCIAVGNGEGQMAKAKAKAVCECCRLLPWAPEATKRCICSGCNLDLGSADHPQNGFLGVDCRELPHVSFIWDLTLFAWPFPSDCADQILCSHLIEHVSPSVTLLFWDEMWRILKPTGQLLAVTPHGQSYFYLQDPTHTTPYVEATFAYFCPDHPSQLYNVYRPAPWKLVRMNSNPLGMIEVVMLPIKKSGKRRSSERR